jgi:hypothetical protein
MKLIKESATLSSKGKKALKESFNKNSKKLNETFAGMDIIDDLVDRAKGWISDGYSVGDAIERSIDDGLIYTRDIIDLADHYGYIDDAELIDKFYGDLKADMKKELEGYETEEGDEELEESLNEVLVDIDEDDLLDLLMNRVRRWTDEKVSLDLYEQMYQSYIDSGWDLGGESVMVIVDNDWVNYCDVVGPGEENYDALLKLYQENGLGDVSVEDVGYSYIEAATEENGTTYLLCRW